MKVTSVNATYGVQAYAAHAESKAINPPLSAVPNRHRQLPANDRPAPRAVVDSESASTLRGVTIGEIEHLLDTCNAQLLAEQHEGDA